METRGDRGRGQCPDVVHVKEEPEHPPPLTCKPTIPLGNLYHSHDIHLGSSSSITAENHIEGLKPPGDSRQSQELGLVKEEPPEHSPQPGRARTLCGPKNLKKIVQLVYPSHGVYFGDHTYVTAETPTELHIKEEPKETSFVYDVKVEALCVDEGELQSSGSHGVSAAAMLAGLYTDHTVKDELLLGPELLHRPSVNQSDPPCVAGQEPRVALALCAWDHTYAVTGSAAEGGRAVSLDAGVAEALRRRCSVRLERLLLDAGRRACRVGRRTYRLRPESEPRRAATPATDTYRCHHCDKAFRHKSLLSKHIHTHLSTRTAHSRCSTREDSNSDRHQKLHTRVIPFKCSLKGKLRRHKSTDTGENSFFCNYCGYKCSQIEYLRRHEMTHTAVKPFKCDYCDYKCSRKESLRRHEMTHTGVKPFQCDYCDYKCSRKESLRRHEMTHTGVKPFQCDYCDYKFSRKEDLRVHEMTHTGIKPFKCNYCDYKCYVKGELRRHEMTHTGVKPFKCDYCDYKCSRKESLRRHEMTHTGVKPFQCDYCDYKCSRKESLRRHEMTHTGVKPFQCDYCDYKFSRKEDLRVHEMTHTGIKPFKCNYCDYKCYVKGELRRHEMTHTGVKPFKCDYCDYKCSRKENLRRHEMTHTGVKPFQCDYCDYKFSSKERLRIHEMKHTGLKPFKCNYCDYKCGVKRDLRRHEIKHTGVKPFKCNYCDYKCSLKGNLRRHVMTHTRVKPFQYLSQSTTNMAPVRPQAGFR